MKLQMDNGTTRKSVGQAPPESGQSGAGAGQSKPNGKRKLPKWVVYGIVVGIVLILGILRYTVGSRKPEAPKKPKTTVSEQKKETATKRTETKKEDVTEEPTGTDADKENQKAALSRLEKEGKVELTEEAKTQPGTTAMTEAMTQLAELKETPFDGRNVPAFHLSDLGPVNILQSFLTCGWAYDSIQWFPSDHSNVYQFVLTLKKEGAPNAVFSGNYLHTKGDLELTTFTDETGEVLSALAASKPATEQAPTEE